LAFFLLSVDFLRHTLGVFYIHTEPSALWSFWAILFTSFTTSCIYGIRFPLFSASHMESLMSTAIHPDVSVNLDLLFVRYSSAVNVTRPARVAFRLPLMYVQRGVM